MYLPLLLIGGMRRVVVMCAGLILAGCGEISAPEQSPQATPAPPAVGTPKSSGTLGQALLIKGRFSNYAIAF